MKLVNKFVLEPILEQYFIQEFRLNKNSYTKMSSTGCTKRMCVILILHMKDKKQIIQR